MASASGTKGLAIVVIVGVAIVGLLLWYPRSSPPGPHSNSSLKTLPTPSAHLKPIETTGVPVPERWGREKTIQGRVVDEGGTPLSTALLWRGNASCGATDSTGLFSLATQPLLGSVDDHVVITAPGYEPLLQEVYAWSTDTVRTVTLLKALAEAEGDLWDPETDAPVSEQGIAVIWSGMCLFVIQSDVNGRWRIPLSREMDLSLAPGAETKDWTWEREFLPRAKPGLRTSALRILAHRQDSTAIVRVISESGDVLRGAEIRVGIPSVYTDERGEATVRVPRSGETVIEATAKGYLAARRTASLIRGETTRIEVRLTKGSATIHGQVRVEERSPIVLTSVEARDTMGNPLVRASISASGGYEINVPENVDLRLLVFFDSGIKESRWRSSPYIDPLVLRAVPQSSLTRDISIPAIRPVTVLVTASDGRPVPKTVVQFERQGGTPGSGTLWGTPLPVMPSGHADDAGRMNALLEAGSWIVTARHPNYRSTRITGFVSKDGPNEFRMVFESVFSVSGIVLHRNGTAAPGVSVGIPDVSKSCLTDREGRFALTLVPGGSHRLTVNVARSTMPAVLSETMVPVAGDVRDLTVLIPDFGAIEATVRAGAELPSEGLRFQCGNDTCRFSVAADERGVFTVNNVPPGSYGYQVVLTEGEASHSLVKGTVLVAECETARLDVDVPQFSRVTVSFLCDLEPAPSRLRCDFLKESKVVKSEGFLIPTGDKEYSKEFVLPVGTYTLRVVEPQPGGGGPPSELAALAFEASIQARTERVVLRRR